MRNLLSLHSLPQSMTDDGGLDIWFLQENCVFYRTCFTWQGYDMSKPRRTQTLQLAVFVHVYTKVSTTALAKMQPMALYKAPWSFKEPPQLIKAIHNHYAVVSQHNAQTLRGDHKRSILFAVRKLFSQGICSVKLYTTIAYIYENSYVRLASCSSEISAYKATVSKRKQNSTRHRQRYFPLLPTEMFVQWIKKANH